MFKRFLKKKQKEEKNIEGTKEIIRAIMKDIVKRYNPAELNVTIIEKYDICPCVIVTGMVSDKLKVKYVGRTIDKNMYINLEETNICTWGQIYQPLKGYGIFTMPKLLDMGYRYQWKK